MADTSIAISDSEAPAGISGDEHLGRLFSALSYLVLVRGDPMAAPP